MPPTSDHVSLLALCRIRNIDWHVIAREASRPAGLGMLLTGMVAEESAEARAAASLLAENLARLDEFRQEIEGMLKVAAREGVQLTTVLDPDYPINLRAIPNRPPFLFYRGTLKAEDVRSLAVVGTREPTPDGLKRAGKTVRLLVEHGIAIISGLALGIDTEAHRTTLSAGGRTIAVLGSGIRRIYPPQNADLAREIGERGAVVSQFWPDSPPATYTFPRRNVTMSGMAQGTVVIEASATSGAKMQARLALEHGKKVFLLDSLVKNYTWAERYLGRGAIRVSDIHDILRHIGRCETAADGSSAQLSLGFGA